jgi:hypothetical protein
LKPVIAPAATDASYTPVPWSAAIAGTLAAMATTFIICALGSGIGLPFASPYSPEPSTTSLTAAEPVWLVMAQPESAKVAQSATDAAIIAAWRSGAHPLIGSAGDYDPLRDRIGAPDLPCSARRLSGRPISIASGRSDWTNTIVMPR